MFNRKKNDAKDASDSKNWYKDRYQYVLVQRNILVLITMISLGASLFSAIAVSQLSPHKSVQPFVVQIDDATGEVRVIKSRSARELSEQEAIDKSNIARFVQAWESYNAAFRDVNNRTVWALSDYDRVYRRYLQQQNPSNEDSIAARLGNMAIREVKIRSIFFLEPQRDKAGIQNYTAQVRFQIIERRVNGQAQQVYNRIALIAYRYVLEEARSSEQVYLNPLGFYVISYDVKEDVL